MWKVEGAGAGSFSSSISISLALGWLKEGLYRVGDGGSEEAGRLRFRGSDTGVRYASSGFVEPVRRVGVVGVTDGPATGCSWSMSTSVELEMKASSEVSPVAWERRSSA